MSVTKAQILQAVATASAGYFSANPMPLSEVQGVLTTFFQAMVQATGGNMVFVENKPKVKISHSVTDDQLACLECGKRMRAIKGHLRMTHGLTPEAYRQKWGLPLDYPMIAPKASELRSNLSRATQQRIKESGEARKGGRRKSAPTTD